MSTCPGYTLEVFLAWNYDLIVDGDGSANLSLQIAEALGKADRRRELTSAQFAPLVALFEPHRDEIETFINNYDDSAMSWRDYGGLFDMPPEADHQARILLGL